jgi:hypothetical protein
MGRCIPEGDLWEIKNLLAEKFPSRARLYRINRHGTKFELARVPA